MRRLFFTEYLKHTRSVGAIAPSSRFLAEKMMRPIKFKQARVIVELGPGTGSFTRELLRRRQRDTTLLLIESNQTFCDQLATVVGGEPNVIIECGSAADLGNILKKHTVQSKADYIVSGLPFASLGKSQSESILKTVIRHLQPKGAFITFQYTWLMRSFFRNYFANISVSHEVRNLPPAHVLTCKLR